MHWREELQQLQVDRAQVKQEMETATGDDWNALESMLNHIERDIRELTGPPPRSHGQCITGMNVVECSRGFNY